MAREINKLVISLRYAPIILPMNHNSWAHNGNGNDYTNNDIWTKLLSIVLILVRCSDIY